MGGLRDLAADSNYGAIGNAQDGSRYRAIDEQGWYLTQAARLMPGEQGGRGRPCALAVRPGGASVRCLAAKRRSGGAAGSGCHLRRTVLNCRGPRGRIGG
jgi:hypothetical protein